MSKEEFLSQLYDLYNEWDIEGIHVSQIEKAHEMLSSKDKFVNSSPYDLLDILLCAEFTIDNDD